MPDIALLTNRERLRKRAREDRILDTMSIIVAIVLLVFRQHSASFKDFTAIVACAITTILSIKYIHVSILTKHAQCRIIYAATMGSRAAMINE